MKKFIITESEKNEIREMYGLLKEEAQPPICNNGGCSGTYTGPEFQNGSDVAHQYSNAITKSVSVKLKELYNSGNYVKVDFNSIKLSTKGMGSGNVTYSVTIPFVSVKDKCEARTGFAHVGGWNHTPELENRKNEILSYVPQGKNENVVVGNELDISPLTKTKEGLQEYWIQWKHKDYQSDCVQNSQNQNKNNQQGININAKDLNDLATQIKTQTQNKSFDFDTIDADLDNFTFSIEPGETQVFKLVLTFNTPEDQNNNIFPSYTNVISKNPTYSPKPVLSGDFENGTRRYSIIALYPPK